MEGTIEANAETARLAREARCVDCGEQVPGHMERCRECHGERKAIEAGEVPTLEEIYGPGGLAEMIQAEWSPFERFRRAGMSHSAAAHAIIYGASWEPPRVRSHGGSRQGSDAGYHGE